MNSNYDFVVRQPHAAAARLSELESALKSVRSALLGWGATVDTQEQVQKLDRVLPHGR